MGQIGILNNGTGQGYIGDYLASTVANTMVELEGLIGVVLNNRPAGKASELLYLIGMVKLAAFDAQGITPVPASSVLMPRPPIPESRVVSELDDYSVLLSRPWNWVYEPLDSGD